MQSKIPSDFRNEDKSNFGYTFGIETVHVIVFKILITYTGAFDFFIVFFFFTYSNVIYLFCYKYDEAKVYLSYKQQGTVRFTVENDTNVVVKIII